MSDVASSAPEAVAPAAAPPVVPPPAPTAPAEPAKPNAPVLDPQLLEDLKAQLAAAAERELNLLKKHVALKYKLPDALALRLMGKTEAELDADAKALVVHVAPPTPPVPTNLPPAAPPGAPAPKVVSDEDVEKLFLKARKASYSL